MCGIVGYIGKQQAAPILISGLKKLEYRGYDSAGVAVFENGNLQSSPTAEPVFQIERCKGKLSNLEVKLARQSMKGVIGIGHTRWATHGAPSEENAHPHRSQRVVVVHNGIIENYLAIKQQLQASGVKFASQTDTEVIPNLIEFHYQKTQNFELAIQKTLQQLEGSFAVVILSSYEPRTLYAAKSRNPLVVGLGEQENFVASDIPALLNYTRSIIILEDGDFVKITESKVEVKDLNGVPRQREVRQINWTASMAEKEGYKHYMLKEIHEQPRAIVNTIHGRIDQGTFQVDLGEAELDEAMLKRIRKITIVACGTSWHAGLYGKYLIESLVRLPVEVDLASEFRYRNPIIDGECLVLGISQSGETADTLAALEEAKRQGSPTMAICNVFGASIPRAVKSTLYTHAGPEIGVASTKAFTTQQIGLFLFALKLAQLRGTISPEKNRQLVQDLIMLPHRIEDVLRTENEIIKLAKHFFQVSDFLYLGRGISFPIALEGALKLKEISYIHAEAYPGGEIKHGPIALIDEKMPVLVLASPDGTFEKILSNLSEVQAREAITILTISKAQKESGAHLPAVDHLIVTPDSHPLLQPIIQVVPLQLLAYHVAVLRGTDVDQPRNLAKSVTVE